MSRPVSGCPASQAPTTLIIACGAIAHELNAIVRANSLGHIRIHCLPAHWHNTPERITPGVEAKLRELRQRFTHVMVAYADCGTGGDLDRLLARYDIERLPGPHCYSFFAGSDAFDRLAAAEPGTFYLTDYLLDNFNRLILDELGIKRHPELRDVYFANYTRLLYLCQCTESKQQQDRFTKAQCAAEALGLPLEIYQTGLGPLEQSIRDLRVDLPW